MVRRSILPCLGAWLLLFCCALVVDQRVAQWLYTNGFHDPHTGHFKHTLLAEAIRCLGTYNCVIIVALALVLICKLTWRKAVTLLLCAATASAAEILKWIVGRARPVSDEVLFPSAMDFAPFSHRATGNSFPSGHAMLAFATATCLARYYPRWSPLFYLLATLVAAERVLEVAHYASDVVAAAGIGIILSQTCMWVLLRSFPEPHSPMLNVVEGAKP